MLVFLYFVLTMLINFNLGPQNLFSWVTLHPRRDINVLTLPSPNSLLPATVSVNSPTLSSSGQLPLSASTTIDPNSPISEITASFPHVPHNTHPMPTRSKSRIVKPRLHPTLLLTVAEPATVTQALSSPEWTHAMQLEYNALVGNNTWTLVP